jgi:hypothetical protein
MECRLAGETEVLGENLPQRSSFLRAELSTVGTVIRTATSRFQGFKFGYVEVRFSQRWL